MLLFETSVVPFNNPHLLSAPNQKEMPSKFTLRKIIFLLISTVIDPILKRMGDSFLVGFNCTTATVGNPL